MLAFAEEIRPAHSCLVPERREELTTEGGLDVAGQEQRIRDAVRRLAAVGSEVSLFIDPDPRQIEASARVGAPAIELHTGRYADAEDPEEQARELQRVREGVALGRSLGLIVNAGHGLHYHNVEPVAAIDGINELNIGHAIVAHALFVGFRQAVAEMKALMLAAATKRWAIAPRLPSTCGADESKKAHPRMGFSLFAVRACAPPAWRASVPAGLRRFANGPADRGIPAATGNASIRWSVVPRRWSG